jgi:hypothetical protein
MEITAKDRMPEKVLKAKDILTENGCTCVLLSGNVEYRSTERGVKPLIDLLDSGKDLGGFIAADKTVGIGAAHLCVLIGVSAVWAAVMSDAAYELLKRYSIDAYCDNKVPYIINREGNGICPIEKATSGIEDPEEALKVIKKTLLDLKGKN